MLSSYRNAFSLKERQNAFYLYPKVEVIYYQIPFVGDWHVFRIYLEFFGINDTKRPTEGADLGVVLSFKTR